MKKLMTEKDCLKARSDELALYNQCVPKLAKKAKKARKVHVKFQRLNEEQRKSVGFGGPVHAKNLLAKLETSLAKALENSAMAKGHVKKLNAHG